ncbi:MAG: glycosyltransferase family 39 protein [Patescibacteria group bacterium]
MNKQGILHKKYAHQILLVTVILIGSLLRIWKLGYSGLRLDEAQSVWQASHTIEYIRFYMAKNVHLPLHNTLLHYWMETFGTSETAVRTLALIPGLLCLPAIYLLAKEVLDKERALIATTIAAVSPFWVWYSREIRMYTLLTFASIMSYYFFVKIIKTHKPGYYLGYILFNILGIYTHYYFGLVLLVQVIFFIAAWKTQINKETKKIYILWGLVISALALILAFIPWLRMLATATNAGTYAPSLTTPNSFNMFLSFFEFTFGYQPEEYAAFIIGLWPLIILLGFIFLTKRQDPFTYWIYFLLLGTVLPVVLTFGVSVLAKPVYLTRYLVSATPLYFILIAWYIDEIRGKLKYGVLVLLFGLMLISLHNQRTSSYNPKVEDYRAATQYINENASPRDLVLLSPPYNIYPVQYYYSSKARMVTIPFWDRRKSGIPAATAETIEKDTEFLRQGHQKMYLLISEDLENAALVRNYFDNHFTKLEKKQFSKYLWVHVYQAEYL